MLNRIIWRLRTEAPWADIPACYRPYTTCVNRFSRWRGAGVFCEYYTIFTNGYGRDMHVPLARWLTRNIHA
ncbi:transposase [Paracoccus aminovorans]|uniref:transposase n=1 Tax=Paracoccus aminovorans TaxID=34004 RepID=UPI00396F351C